MTLYKELYIKQKLNNYLYLNDNGIFLPEIYDENIFYNEEIFKKDIEDFMKKNNFIFSINENILTVSNYKKEKQLKKYHKINNIYPLFIFFEVSLFILFIIIFSMSSMKETKSLYASLNETKTTYVDLINENNQLLEKYQKLNNELLKKDNEKIINYFKERSE